MVKSRQRKLDERWGSETSAKGTRFKLNRDLPGYHDSRRNAIEIEEDEKEVRIRIDVPPDLRASGTLVYLENVGWGYSKENLIGGVTLGIEQGGKLGVLGAVGYAFPRFIMTTTCYVFLRDTDVPNIQNGQGKTTLAKLIVGQVQPRSGTTSRHPNMRVGYFTQVGASCISIMQVVLISSCSACGGRSF